MFDWFRINLQLNILLLFDWQPPNIYLYAVYGGMRYTTGSDSHTFFPIRPHTELTFSPQATHLRVSFTWLNHICIWKLLENDINLLYSKENYFLILKLNQWQVMILNFVSWGLTVEPHMRAQTCTHAHTQTHALTLTHVETGKKKKKSVLFLDIH